MNRSLARRRLTFYARIQSNEEVLNKSHRMVDRGSSGEAFKYRPGRSPRAATRELSNALHDGKHRWVVEADIRGFFDHIDHDWLVKMPEERVADKSLIRIIRKWLKAE